MAKPPTFTLEWADFDREPESGLVTGCTWDDVEAILGVLCKCEGGSGFVIVSQTDERYIQAATPEEGEPITIEYRDGSGDRHFEIDEEVFGAARLTAIFKAYFERPGEIGRAAAWRRCEL